MTENKQDNILSLTLLLIDICNLSNGVLYFVIFVSLSYLSHSLLKIRVMSSYK
jgi:hypothetical protein